LSSTTDRTAQRGQILVLFAGGLVTVMLVAALAFDVGMMLVERRAQQNTADAAALHAARYVIDEPYGVVEARAKDLALNNGYGDDPTETVTVHIPPVSGSYAGLPGFVEVEIDATRPSIFGGILGRAGWPVGVFAVAGNQQGVTISFGMLSLNRTACNAIQVTGGGSVISAASIHSSSSGAECPGDPVGFLRNGNGTIQVPEGAFCRSAGELLSGNNGSMNCEPVENSFGLPDPLLSLQAPAKPGLAAPLQQRPTDTQVDVPDYCPGATDPRRQPSEANPRTCVLGNGPGQAGRRWILRPGLYPGGIDVGGNVTAYLLPGTYWIGGGGFKISSGSVISIDAQPIDTQLDLSPGGGVLIYNSKLPGSAGKPIESGGSGAVWQLRPLLYPFQETMIDLVIFQDREVCQDVTLNGSASNASAVRGIVYVPCGEVKLNGSGSTFTLDQIIADTIKTSGTGTITVLRESGIDAEISGIGLVE
jgi:hypothetical protein